MNHALTCYFHQVPIMAMLLLAWLICQLQVQANPTDGTVTQGTASFTTSGSQLTINQTSGSALINWQSFNIAAGETTVFNQPSSSSVTWNYINDPSASSINGNLSANGYVVLQNPNGFTVGGQATITAHGLVMTTASTPALNLSSGGAWSFNTPPPTARIVNYGQINITGGGSAFLIASDIENNGTISAPGGRIGLYAGQTVLVSTSPDGRGLSARVTLPEGSVDNNGNLIADGGSIAAQAQVVNQGGLIQANSVQNINGVIELVASDSLNLSANSIISAHGDTQGASSGGSVTIKSDNNFSDQTGSTINISGGAQGGNGGQVDISAPQMNAINSSINGRAADGFVGGKLTIDPYNITLDSAYVSSLNALIAGGLSQIDLQADNNIELSTPWTLTDSTDPTASLNLTAGNNIILDNGAAINGGNNWSVNLTAGTGFIPTTTQPKPTPGNDGIYLNGDSYIQTQNGSISLWAANEVIVNPGPPYQDNTGDVGNNGIRTLNGGSIDVTTEYGDVNTGGNYQGYLFGDLTAPYYSVSPTLGGISTAAGGDVTITAGGNVTSYLPVQNDYSSAQYDGGTGAFGPQPGNVTITAGGNVSGHYVMANGVGTVTAGGNIGAPIAYGGFALSLVKGSWSVYAPNGSIYVQDIRNPNGVFDDFGDSVSGFAGYHLFDYDSLASVVLQAGNSVEITGAGAPHGILSSPGSFVPMLFPSTLDITTGAGGFVLDTDVILFPSANGELHITTLNGGNFQSYQDPVSGEVTVHSLMMSDSAAKQWDPFPPADNFGSFLANDHAATPTELNNLNPVEISVSGSMRNVNLRTTKATHIKVDGDMFNAGFVGENLHDDDVTSINVAGTISYSPVYAFTTLSEGIVGIDPRNPSAWDAIFSYMVDPNLSLEVTSDVLRMTPAQQTAYAYSHVRLVLRGGGYQLQPGYDPNANPGFIYDPATGQLGFQYQMQQNVLSALDSAAIPVLKLDQQGHVIIEQHADGKYYFATTTASFIPTSALEALSSQSLNSVRDALSMSPGFQIGGPGQFNINAASMDLGSSAGIISWGISSAYNPVNYESLAPWTPSGAAVDVNVSGDISLLSSTIASIFGGDVTVTSGGNLYLSQGNFALIPTAANIAYGIWTSGYSDVIVDADGDINIGGARIGTFNGGNVLVRSEHGDVNAGNGANSLLIVPEIHLDPATGQFVSGTIQGPRPFGSGIMAISPTANYQAVGSSGLPGNITVETPEGNIISTLGGIQQLALNGSIAGGPTITLTAGRSDVDATPDQGNIDLGQGGAIGGTLNFTPGRGGSVKGLIIARQDVNINTSGTSDVTVLAGGSANFSGGGSVAGMVVGIGGINVSGDASVTATLLSQNVSAGSGTESTLGTSANATSASQSAAQQASSDAKQQVASNDTEDNEKMKKKNPLVRWIKRVTVLLSKV